MVIYSLFIEIGLFFIYFSTILLLFLLKYTLIMCCYGSFYVTELCLSLRPFILFLSLYYYSYLSPSESLLYIFSGIFCF